MNPESSVDVRAPGQLRVALRDDLRISIQSFQDGWCYLLEDPVETRFFQVGIAEGTFLSLLDGTRTLEDAVRHATAALGDKAFSEQEAFAIVHWLIEARLGNIADSTMAAGAWIDAATTAVRQPVDPLAIRFPLVRGNSLLQLLLPWCNWLFARPMTVLWCLLCVAASCRVAAHWDSFTQAAMGTLVPGQWWSLIAVGLVLKLLHETAHGLVCWRYGGSVSEAGVMLLCGLPVPYVDVTACWAFRSKFARIHTAAAGMYIETLVAAIAGLVWNPADANLFSQICIQMMVVGVGSLFFNANPLMRFDGYYILMDVLGIPNLATRANRYWTAKVTYCLHGMRAVLPNYGPGERRFILCYGLLSFFWRYLVYFTLAILAAASLPIDEKLVPQVAVLLIATIVVVQRMANANRGTVSSRPGMLRPAVTVSLIMIVGWLGLFCVPFPRRITAPGIVEYEPLHRVRTLSPGFVRDVRVRSGDAVQQGDVIIVLVNPELHAELADLELAIEQSMLTLRTLQQQRATAAHTAELQNLAGLRNRYEEKKLPIERLVLRAPTAGKVVSRLTELALGTYLESGTEVAAIGEQARKELKVSISQEDVHGFADAVGKETRVRIGNTVFHGRLTSISPRADLSLTHSAMSATEGGPLAVRFAGQPDAGPQSPTLHMPHFTAQVALPAAYTMRLGAGQRGQIAIAAPELPLGTQLFQSMNRWCRDKVREIRGDG